MGEGEVGAVVSDAAEGCGCMQLSRLPFNRVAVLVQLFVVGNIEEVVRDDDGD